MSIYFISGIDTDAGKSIITGLLAQHLLKQGKSVATFKLVQTGCEGIAEDIQLHRKFMGIPLTEADKNGDSCPYVFKHPASPHLSAKLEGREIDPQLLLKKINKLESEHDYVLIEGAGGLQVPIKENFTTLDFIQKNNYPVILVTNAKLGSINHSLLSLECLKWRKIELKATIYNSYPNTDSIITQDSKVIIQDYTKRLHPNALFYEIPQIDISNNSGISFAQFIVGCL